MNIIGGCKLLEIILYMIQKNAHIINIETTKLFAVLNGDFTMIEKSVYTDSLNLPIENRIILIIESIIANQYQKHHFSYPESTTIHRVIMEY